MGSIKRLDSAARRLSHDARRRAPFHLAFMTDARRIPDPRAVLRRLPRGAAVVLRDYDMPAPARFALARSLRDAAADRGVFFLVGGDPSLARALEADGAHLPTWYEGGAHAFRAEAPGFMITRSAHDRKQLAFADRDGATAIFVSPVFRTRSHPGGRPLGVDRLADFVRASRTPVLALGGVDARKADRMVGTGVAGLAAIGAFSAD